MKKSLEVAAAKGEVLHYVNSVVRVGQGLYRSKTPPIIDFQSSLCPQSSLFINSVITEQ